MESTASLEPIQQATSKEAVYAYDLLAAFDEYNGQINTLSLDCFDTILWRKTATPSDVFYHLQNKPTFQSLNINATLRARSEAYARNLRVIQDNSNEVTLHDIYLARHPGLTENQLNNLAEEELAAEMEICYAFTPIVELMRKAAQQGLKIIVVSDTYLKESQLRRLLAHCLPADVMASIDKIFCSCEYGHSKGRGLFKDVLAERNVSSQNILHIGDNPVADFKAARKAHIPAIQLLHHNQLTSELFHMRSVAGAIFNPLIRQTKPYLTPFRGLIAQKKIEKPEELIGYASVGPIMYTFAKFLQEDIKELKKTGKNPKVLFLLRDAYLPARVCEAIAGEPLGKLIRISRFSSYAASFRTKKDIDNYLLELAQTRRFKDICKQLLLPESIIEPLVIIASNSSDPVQTFIEQIQNEQVINIIIKMSADYRKRFFLHLQKEVNLKSGDTLVFVDLGYAGTAQRLLEPVLREELNIEVLGRYLIELNIADWEKSRRGLLDPSWCDDRSMYSIVAYIALLEQICTTNEKSVIDYDAQGNAIYSDIVLGENQHTKLEKIQKECVQFAIDAEKMFASTEQPSMQVLRENAMIDLARFVFLSTEAEINYLQSFQFDMNMGTKDVISMFDPAEGLASMRKRGLYFSFMERTSDVMRTNYPAELRSAGLDLAFTLMAQLRFGVEFNFKEMSFRREKVNVVVLQDNQTAKYTLEANLTYDGFFALTIPVAKHSSAILFGEKFQWLQFENADLIASDAYLQNVESMYSQDHWSQLAFSGMNEMGEKLFECEDPTAALIIPPLLVDSEKNYLLRLVFRPLITRK